MGFYCGLRSTNSIFVVELTIFSFINFRLKWFVVGYFFFFKGQDIVKMIIFKLISTRLKKNLGSKCSNFYFKGVKTKKKIYI